LAHCLRKRRRHRGDHRAVPPVRVLWNPTSHCYTSSHWSHRMRIARGVLGGLLILIGIVWILQGINVLPGSFMTGQTQWSVYGGIAAAVGVGLLWTAKRRTGG
jgi:hypothetical protein